MGRVVIPYKPRSPFQSFHSRTQRWSSIVAHRRCGKTVAHINDTVKRAIQESKPDGRYGYIAPFRQQAKDAAWNYLKRYTEQLVKSVDDVRESDLSVQIMGGPTVRLYGADNPNAMRGPYLDGAVLDEYAFMRPSLWGEVVRPMLADRHGWAAFIGTPCGHDAFYDLHRNAEASPGEWYSATLKASETGILPASELADLRKDMTQDQYDQEFECSFEAAIIGAVYAKELKICRDQGRIKRVPYDDAKLVNCSFDIGKRDATSIWFYQLIAGEVRIIDFFEDHLEGPSYYAAKLKGRGYKYDTLYLPHDANNEAIAADVTFAGAMQKNGFKVEMLKKISPEDGINAARMLFSKIVFDAERCAPGLEALQNYRWGYNPRMDELKTEAVHDWSSHAADSFRYLATSVRLNNAERTFHKPLAYPRRAYV